MKRTNTRWFFRSFFLTLIVLICGVLGFGGFVAADQNTKRIAGANSYQALSIDKTNEFISLSFLGMKTEIDTKAIGQAVKKAEPAEYLICPQYRLITDGLSTLQNKVITAFLDFKNK